MSLFLSEKEIVKSLWLGRVADLQFQQEVERELVDFKFSILEAVEKWAEEYSEESGGNINFIELSVFLKEAREEILYEKTITKLSSKE